jgi:hypothetical protein
MHRIIVLIPFIAAVSGLHINRRATVALIVRKRAGRTIHRDKLKKCNYLNQQFINTCPNLSLYGYKNIYEKSYANEDWVYYKNKCVQELNPFGVLMLLFVVLILIINCLA